MNLKPCPYRHVGDEGHILCDKIKSGDREISPNICRACPINAINCAHLRGTLEHRARPPITVRYGNGRTEVWDEIAPTILLERAACSAKVIPITSPRDCAGCALRQAMVTIETIAMPRTQTADRRPFGSAQSKSFATIRRTPRGAPTPIVAHQPTPPINDEPRKSLVAQKILQLQEWLTKQKSAPRTDAMEQEPVLPVAVSAGRVVLAARGEEKRVGWTD